MPVNAMLNFISLGNKVTEIKYGGHGITNIQVKNKHHY